MSSLKIFYEIRLVGSEIHRVHYVIDIALKNIYS